jgi:branched-chain amino acid transport system ATP-binding protein
LSPAERVRRGLVFVPAGGAVFRHLTVADNLLVAWHQFAWDRPVVEARTSYVLGLFPGLAQRLEQRARTLSGGEQQMLALAKGLVLDPSVLLVDELTLGLAPEVVADLTGVLATSLAALLVVCSSPAIADSLAARQLWLERGSAPLERRSSSVDSHFPSFGGKE